MKRLTNKVAFITGAANGIGKVTALLFAEEGAKLVLTDVNLEELKSVEGEIKKKGGEAISLTLDVRKEDEWKKAVEKAEEVFGAIDVLFNNAGIYRVSLMKDTNLESWNQMLEINVTGVFLGMKYVAPVMAKSKKGSIINASSVAAVLGSPGYAAYGASKGAVRTMSKDGAMEFASSNIRVNSIHPGFITTNMAKQAAGYMNQSYDEISSGYPLRRLGEPIEVAKVVLFLASDESSYVTGTELFIDGGVTSGTAVGS